MVPFITVNQYFSIILTLYKTQKRRLTIAFVISVLGFTVSLEVILVIIFNAYSL